MNREKLAILFIFFFGAHAIAGDFDCLDLNLKPELEKTITSSLTGDFELRDSFRQTEVEKNLWKSCCGSFGPCPLPYPKVVYESSDKQNPSWDRERAVAVAMKYIGLPYGHFHIPAMGGLDCSNFTSWVYNYGFGIRISSNITHQATSAGRKLDTSEPLKPGDLIFLYDGDRNNISHVAIFVDENRVIDSSYTQVAVRPRSGRYLTQFAFARRIFE